ncbi:MAG: histidine kinase [Paenibacillus sp.]|nr:histidine kinase [Paenibacillus sp.]
MINRLFKKFHISHLYFWSTSIFVVLLFAVVIWTSYYFSVQGMIQTTSSYQERILTELNEKLQTRFAAIESVSLSIVRNNELLELLTTEREPYQNVVTQRNVVASLNTLTFSTPSIFSIDIYTRDLPISGNQELVRFVPLNEIEQVPWFSSIASSDFAWIGEHMTNSYQGQVSVVSFARKIYSAAGDYKGIVVVHIKASDIQKLLLEKDAEPNRLLLDSGNRLITQVGGEGVQDNKEFQQFIADNLGAPSHHEENGYRQYTSRSLIVWTQVKGSDWLLIEITPWKQLVAGSTRMAGILLTISIAAVCILVLFFLFLNSRFTEPIFILLRAMNQFPVAKEPDMLPTDYQNEFGQLFQGYRKLLLRIEELYESIKVQYRKQKESEIGALQAMINPHFLYNTLDQLNWMAIKDGNEKMSRVLELTGRMLRIGLSNGKSLILLTEELEHIECYMQIQQIRLGDDIRYSIELPDSLLSCYVPKMTLQPFVENCIRHGFHGRKGGSIQIFCQSLGQEVMISIADNGNGLQEGSGSLHSKTKGGYGISNVKERMTAFFGTDEGIDIRNQTDGGTVVTLRFPWIQQDETREEA